MIFVCKEIESRQISKQMQNPTKATKERKFYANPNWKSPLPPIRLSLKVDLDHLAETLKLIYTYYPVTNPLKVSKKADSLISS